MHLLMKEFNSSYSPANGPHLILIEPLNSPDDHQQLQGTEQPV